MEDIVEMTPLTKSKFTKLFLAGLAKGAVAIVIGGVIGAQVANVYNEHKTPKSN